MPDETRNELRPAVLTRGVDVRTVTRAVVINQALWTAGYTLCTGGFLTYFAYELGATAVLLAVVLITPETAGLSSLFTRSVVSVFGRRQFVWSLGTLAGRLVSLGIPLMAFPALWPDGVDPLWILIGCLAVSQALQAIAYTAYISWLADLVPEYRWGRFFARRNVARVCISLVVPVAAGFARDWWKREMTGDAVLLAYVLAFSLGVVLMLASMLPLLRLPDVPVREMLARTPAWRVFAAAMSDSRLRLLCLYSWWLAFFNGLAQTAFVAYRIQRLEISLGTYYVLENTMYLLMIPVSLAAGFVSDRFGNKVLIVWGVPAASSGMAFWFLATPDQWWWLFGASVMWSCFAAVNIGNQNLLLSSHRGATTRRISPCSGRSGALSRA